MGQSSGEIIALAIVFTVLPATAIVLRIWARKMIGLPLPVDEWLVYISFVAMTGLLTVPLILMCAYANLGNKTKGGVIVPPSRLFNICARIIEAGSHIPLALAKASILLFLKRIFSGLLHAAVVWTLLATVIAWSIAFFLAELLSCVPVVKSFSLPLPSPLVHCIDPVAIFQASAVSNIILELIIMIIPGPLVARLRMPLRWKIAVTGIFLLGAITIAASTTKLYYFFRVGHYGGEDITYIVAPPLYWTVIESGLSNTAVCLPCLGPIFNMIHRTRTRQRTRNVLTLHSDDESQDTRQARGAVGISLDTLSKQRGVHFHYSEEKEVSLGSSSIGN